MKVFLICFFLFIKGAFNIPIANNVGPGQTISRNQRAIIRFDLIWLLIWLQFLKFGSYFFSIWPKWWRKGK